MKIILKIIIIILIFIPLFFASILFFDDGNLKYSQQIEINKPIDLVNVLFEDIYNMKKYMPGTQEVILISGKDKKSGAKYKIIVTAVPKSGCKTTKVAGMNINNKGTNELCILPILSKRKSL